MLLLYRDGNYEAVNIPLGVTFDVDKNANQFNTL